MATKKPRATTTEQPYANAVSRLRESKAKYEKERRERGLACGEGWATETAEYEELKRLAEAVEMDGCDFFHIRDDRPQAVRVAETIAPDCDAEEFWQGITRDGFIIDCELFLAGFIEGAMKVWEAVERQP